MWEGRLLRQSSEDRKMSQRVRMAPDMYPPVIVLCARTPYDGATARAQFRRRGTQTGRQLLNRGTRTNGIPAVQRPTSCDHRDALAGKGRSGAPRSIRRRLASSCSAIGDQPPPAASNRGPCPIAAAAGRGTAGHPGVARHDVRTRRFLALRETHLCAHAGKSRHAASIVS